MIILSNDIGNSETKMKMNGFKFRQPSVIKNISRKPDVHENDLQKNIVNLLDDLTVHITSNAVKHDGIYLVGKKANLTASDVDNMDITLGNKYKHDIPVILTLSMISGRYIQTHYEENNELPSLLEIEVGMTTAIPASEYTVEKARTLENRFLDNEHIVIVYVGDKSVTTKIKFNKVKVTKEGVPSLYALIESDSSILKHYNQKYKKNALPRDFVGKKLLHIDIGDGTTEYIYTDGLNPVHDLCKGERRGVGHATEEALQLLIDDLEGNIELNRQQFMNFLLKKSGNEKIQKQAEHFMSKAKYKQAERILSDVAKMSKTTLAGNIDGFVVYGGGSIQFKDELIEELYDFAETIGVEVIWIPEDRAVDMNLDGMDVLNEKVLFKV